MTEMIRFETFENTLRYEMEVEVVREQRDGKPQGLVDLLVECRKGTLPVGGVLNYPRDLGRFWLCQTGGNVWEGPFGISPFRIVED